MKQFNPGAPDEAVIEDAKTKLDLARESLADLARLGITRAWLDQFQAQIQAYEILPTDAAMLRIQRSLTADKDDTLKQCETWGNTLRDRCKFSFGPGPRNPFPTNDFRTALRNESKMLQVLPNLIDIASQHALLLVTVGQPPEYAAQGQTLRDRLDQLNRQQEKAKRDRKVATDNRHQALKTVYEALSHLNAVARAVYRNQPTQRALFKALANRVPPTAPESDRPESTAQ